LAACLGLCRLALRAAFVPEFVAHALEQAEAQQEHDAREGQGCGDGHALQALQTPGEEEDGGRGGDGQPPCQFLAAGRVLLAAGGHHAEHKGGRVRRGDEEDHQQEDGQGRQHAAQGVVGIELERARGNVSSYHRGDIHPLFQFQMKGGTPENAEPQEGQQGRHDQCSGHEFPDGSAAGDAGHEETHERGPGNPPCPVKEGPVLGPLRASERVGGQAQGEQVGGVVGESADEDVEHLVGRSCQKHEAENGQGQHDVGLAQHLDAPVKAGHAGNDEQDRDRGDDDQGAGETGLDGQYGCQSAVDLHGPESQGGDDAEDRGEDGQDVDEVPDRTVDALPDERVEAA